MCRTAQRRHDESCLVKRRLLEQRGYTKGRRRHHSEPPEAWRILHYWHTYRSCRCDWCMSYTKMRWVQRQARREIMDYFKGA